MTEERKLIEQLTGALQALLAYANEPDNEMRRSVIEQAERAFVAGADRLSWTRRMYNWETRT